jgi:hypothetical protein
MEFLTTAKYANCQARQTMLIARRQLQTVREAKQALAITKETAMQTVNALKIHSIIFA